VFLLSVRAEQSVATAALRVDAVHLFVRPFVCRQNAYTKIRFFLSKIKKFRAMVSSLLTTNRKSYMMFRKNLFWTPNNFNNNFNNNFFESDNSPEHWPSHSCSTSSIFIARSNADARYWVEQLCLSVCPSVCPSRSGIVSKRLNISSQFLHDTVAQSSYTVRIIT